MRGFGIAAGLDSSVGEPLGELCQSLGYSSLWSNDHPAASGLATVARLGSSAPALDLGVGAIALDRRSPEDIVAEVERTEVDPKRLIIAVGAGKTRRPLGMVRAGIENLYALLPDDVRVVIAAMGPKMSELAGELADGVFLNWMTPRLAATISGHVRLGAERVGRTPPPIVFGYVRVAVDQRAADRLAKEEAFYRDLHPHYRRHFSALGAEEGTVGIASDDPDAVQRELGRYERSIDHVVVRALASARTEAMGRVAEAAAPGRMDS